MDVITIDFETYYDKDYQLKKLTTEQYVRSDKFEIILVSVKVNDGEVISCSGQDASWFLSQYDFESSAVLTHNANFDGAILSWRYGRTAKLWLDTTAMARPFHGQTIGVSLRKLVEHYTIGDKGDAVYSAIGKRLVDFSTEELAQYAEYNRTDVELTYKLFKKLRHRLPSSELLVIDQTVKMFIEPMLNLDVDVLTEHLKSVREKKEELLNSVGGEDFRKNIMSNDKFAEQLRLLGVEPPTKISVRTGKSAFAFAKTDKEFLALQEHKDEKVQTLVAARLGVKSTIEETRTEAFLDIATRGKLPVPLMYWGAHTGRFSGSDKINLQNLTRGGKLRDSIVAPPDKMLVVSDLSQIEARLLAYIAGQADLVKAFAEGRDVYSEFASDIYDRKVTKEDKRERFVGKTCILGLGYGTGPDKLKSTLGTGQGGISVDVDISEAVRIVGVYRGKNDKITTLWRKCQNAIASMSRGESGAILEDVGVRYVGHRVLLPNDMPLTYTNLRYDGKNYVYDTRKGTVKIYGAKLVENIVQALAAIAIKEHMVAISKHYKLALQVHDEIVCVVRETEVEGAVEVVRSIMSTPPVWASGLPIACEVGYAKRYGDAK